MYTGDGGNRGRNLKAEVKTALNNFLVNWNCFPYDSLSPLIWYYVENSVASRRRYCNFFGKKIHVPKVYMNFIFLFYLFNRVYPLVTTKHTTK